MPCYRCGTRQVDPDRGESPWKRGVRGDRQVLICPACQVAHDWTADLDHCPVCSSVKLVRRLGEAECRDCGSVRPPAASALPGHLAVLARVSRGVAGGGGPGASGFAAGASGAGSSLAGSSLAGASVPAGSGADGSGAGGSGPGGSGSLAGAGPGESAAMQELAAEVEQALARVLGRTAGSAAGG
jgi:hypothetical protein